MSKEDREYYRRLKKIKKHTEALSEFVESDEQSNRLKAIDSQVDGLREARERQLESAQRR